MGWQVLSEELWRDRLSASFFTSHCCLAFDGSGEVSPFESVPDWRDACHRSIYTGGIS